MKFLNSWTENGSCDKKRRMIDKNENDKSISIRVETSYSGEWVRVSEFSFVEGESIVHRGSSLISEYQGCVSNTFFYMNYPFGFFSHFVTFGDCWVLFSNNVEVLGRKILREPINRGLKDLNLIFHGLELSLNVFNEICWRVFSTFSLVFVTPGG